MFKHKLCTFVGWGVVWINKRAYHGFGWNSLGWGFSQLHNFSVVTFKLYFFQPPILLISILFYVSFHSNPSLNIFHFMISLMKKISTKNKILLPASFTCFIMMILRKWLRYGILCSESVASNFYLNVIEKTLL